MTVAAVSAPVSRAVAEAACAHCGLPVPRGLIEPDAEAQFCCGGCRAVHETIHRCGLDRYYAMRDDEAARPASAPRADYAAFDDEAFQDRHVARGAPGASGAATVDLHVERAHCAACVWLLERLPRVVPGVRTARLDIRRKRLRVSWDAERVALSAIARRLDTLGYPPAPCTDRDVDLERRRETREHLVRLGVAGACAGNAMLIAFALYGGMFSGMDETHRLLLRGASLLVTIVAVAWPGRVFFTGAIASLRTRAMHMDVPVALALGLGTAWGAVNTIRGTGEVYFESLTAVVFLLLIGRWVQHRQHRSAHEAVERLYDLTPARARVLDEHDGVRTVAVAELARGNRVELRAGDSVPADGTILEGQSTFDLSMLTGESRPVTLGPGDRVHAGTTNSSARVVLRAERTGAETRLGRLAALIETLAADRPPIVRLADRLARRFVWVVLTVAAATAALWLAIEPGRAVEHTIALLIVTCPCALGLATPLAVVASIGQAARNGMMIKGGAVVERLAKSHGRTGIVLLDKTGTLTEGKTRLVQWHGDDEVLPLVAAIERHASHPTAQALTGPFDESPAAKMGTTPNSGDTPKTGTTPSSVDAPKMGTTPNSGDTPKTGTTPNSGDAPKMGTTPDSGDAPKMGTTPDSGCTTKMGTTPNSGGTPRMGTQFRRRPENGDDPQFRRHSPSSGDDVRVSSRGVAGTVAGRVVVVGAPDFVRERCGEATPPWAAHAERACTDAALTPVLVAVDGRIAGVAGLGDPIRPDAAAAVAALRGLGWTVGILSGDHPQVVASVADAVGIDADQREGNATPERKVEAVRAARAEFDTVVMVGDGVNDAAALTAADVGIAVSGGAEASLRAADAFLRRADLAGIADLVRGSDRTVGVIRRNLLASLFYNVLAGSLAIAGVINPLIAAALMPLSSLTVVTLSYRSRTFGGMD